MENEFEELRHIGFAPSAPSVADLRGRLADARRRRLRYGTIFIVLIVLSVGVGIGASLDREDAYQLELAGTDDPEVVQPLDDDVVVGVLPSTYELRLDSMTQIPEMAIFDRYLTFTPNRMDLTALNEDGATGQNLAVVVRVSNRRAADIDSLMLRDQDLSSPGEPERRVVKRRISDYVAVMVTGPIDGVDLEAVLESVEVNAMLCVGPSGVSDGTACEAGFEYSPSDFGGSVDPEMPISTDTTVTPTTAD